MRTISPPKRIGDLDRIDRVAQRLATSGCFGGNGECRDPIQVIAANTTPPELIYYGPNASYQQNYNPCLINPVTGNPDTAAGYNDDTVATLGANGILGVGNQAQDCGINCTTLTNTYDYTNGPYMICSGAVCGIQAVAQANQVWNPVAAFPTDNNGESIQLPSVPAAGAANNAVTGTMTFGIGTETNNAITTQTIYEANCEADLNEVMFNNIPYFDVASNNQTNCQTANASFIDSGSNALYILDPGTLTTATGITTVNCTDNGWYCPQSTLNLGPFPPSNNLAFTIYGQNSTQGTVSLSIANADSLFSGNENAAFFNLGGCCFLTVYMPALGATNLDALGLDLGIIELELREALFTLDNHLRLPAEKWWHST